MDEFKSYKMEIMNELIPNIKYRTLQLAGYNINSCNKLETVIDIFIKKISKLILKKEINNEKLDIIVNVLFEKINDDNIDNLGLKAFNEIIDKIDNEILKEPIKNQNVDYEVEDIEKEIVNKLFFKMLNNKIHTVSDEKIKNYSKKIENIASLDINSVKREPDLIVEILAVAMLALNKSSNVCVYDEQLLAAISMFGYKKKDRVFVDMKTGEGKTYASLLAAYLYSIFGNVHIVTSNYALAERDFKANKNFFDLLGIEVGLVKKMDAFQSKEIQDQIIKDKKEAYRKRITYVDSTEIGFDCLRDLAQLDIKERFQTKYDFIIIDEVDNILLDQASSPFVLADVENTEEFEDEELYKKIMIELEFFVSKLSDLDIDNSGGKLVLNDSGYEKLEKFFDKINSTKFNLFNFVDFVNALLVVHKNLRNNEDYIINDDKTMDFELISQTTGFPLKGQSYENPHLTYAIKLHNKHLTLKDKFSEEEIKTLLLDIELPVILKNSKQIIYSTLLSNYEGVTGMSGTSTISKEAFKKYYYADVIDIPLHKDLSRIDKDLEIFFSNEEKMARLKNIIEEEIKTKPILIRASTINDANNIFNFLQTQKNKGDLNANLNLLTAANSTEYSKIIKMAGNKNQITVVTDVAGRGTDIKLSDEVKQYGLCVINTDLTIARVDKQFRGRSGRQGQNGVSYSLTDLDEEIYYENNSIFQSRYSDRFDKQKKLEKKKKIIKDFIYDIQERKEEEIIRKLDYTYRNQAMFENIFYSNAYKLRKNVFDTGSVECVKDYIEDFFYIPFNKKEEMLLDCIDHIDFIEFINKLTIKYQDEILEYIKYTSNFELMTIPESSRENYMIDNVKKYYKEYIIEIQKYIKEKCKELLIIYNGLEELFSYDEEVNEEDIKWLLKYRSNHIMFLNKNCTNVETLKESIEVYLKDFKKKEELKKNER